MSFDLAWKQAFEAGLRASGPQTVKGADGTDRNFVCVPDGVRLESLAEIRAERDEPRRLTKTQLYTAESFSRYVNQYGDGTTRIWADERSPFKVSAILDFHKQSEVVDALAEQLGSRMMGAPAHGEHVAWLRLERHPLWTEILGRADKAMSQTEFCEWIEEHRRAFVEPNAATMSEVATTLRAASDVNWASKVKLQSGAVVFSYVENVVGRTGDSGEAEIPAKFTMRSRLFVGGKEELVTCHFRYRLQSGKLGLFYKLYGTEELERDAFIECVESIKAATGIDPFYGKRPALRHPETD